MAVAVPVLEKTSKETKETQFYNYGSMSADELHNARISDNLARLLNPENKIKDVVASIDVDGTQVLRQSFAEEQTDYAEPVQIAARPVVLVKNARANSELFRADSPVNAIDSSAYYGTQMQSLAEEEENEDLRPTSTTIQYQTIGNTVQTQETFASAVSDKKEEVSSSRESRINLAKRDKIIIGIIVGLIFAVFVLIIVNSAIISNLTSDINALEDRAQQATAEYQQVIDNINEVSSLDNLYNFAVENDLI